MTPTDRVRQAAHRSLPNDPTLRSLILSVCGLVDALSERLDALEQQEEQ